MKCAKPSYAFALAMHIKDINKTKQTIKRKIIIIMMNLVYPLMNNCCCILSKFCICTCISMNKCVMYSMF